MELPYLKEGAEGNFHWQHIYSDKTVIKTGLFQVVKVRSADFIIRATFSTGEVKEKVYCSKPKNTKDFSTTTKLRANGYTLHTIEKTGMQYILSYTFH